MKTVKDILKKLTNEISGSMNIDPNSKRIKFIDHVYYLTGTSIDNVISKSWLSKLNNKNYTFHSFNSSMNCCTPNIRHITIWYTAGICVYWQ